MVGTGEESAKMRNGDETVIPYQNGTGQEDCNMCRTELFASMKHVMNEVRWIIGRIKVVPPQMLALVR